MTGLKENNNHDTVQRLIRVFTETQRDRSGEIVALIVGAIALLDPDNDFCAVTLLDMAINEAGNLRHLLDFEEALTAAGLH